VGRGTRGMFEVEGSCVGSGAPRLRVPGVERREARGGAALPTRPLPNSACRDTTPSSGRWRTEPDSQGRVGGRRGRAWEAPPPAPPQVVVRACQVGAALRVWLARKRKGLGAALRVWLARKRKGFGAALRVWLARKRKGFGAALCVWLARKRKGFGAALRVWLATSTSAFGRDWALLDPSRKGFGAALRVWLAT